MNNSLIHWGIPGMHWGVRRRNLTPSSRHLSKAGGKLSIVTKRWGDKKVVHKKQVTPEEAKSFVAQQNKQKANDLVKKTNREKRLGRAVIALVTVYSAVSIVNMVNPRIFGAIAWNTGKIISNSPLG